MEGQVINIEQHLHTWVAERLHEHKNGELAGLDFQWEALPGDAGFRRYFRVNFDHVSLIAVHSPPENQKNREFLLIDEFLFQHGVHVPKILAYDMGHGFLLEDLGSELYLDHLNEETVNTLYGEALLTLLRLQQCPLDYSVFPVYNRERLLEELKLFPQWFIREMLAYELSDEEKLIISEAFEVLLMAADEQPKVLVHRDYHSRNLIYGVGGTPGVIDFQDAVIGPFTYDLVSLLRDCYVAWPEQQVKDWVLAYGNMAVDAGVIPLISEDQLLRWFDLMGLQRHIKVLGIFARLSLRDGKHQYLNDLPLVLKYTRTVAARHEALNPFMDWFEQSVMPHVAQQAWYREATHNAGVYSGGG